MMSLRELARALGGEVSGGEVLCPGPGHGATDRSLSVLITGSDFVVHSFAGDDWRVCKDYVRSRLGRPSFNHTRRS
jgi:putative DNA primase/helicase